MPGFLLTDAGMRTIVEVTPGQFQTSCRGQDDVRSAVHPILSVFRERSGRRAPDPGDGSLAGSVGPGNHGARAFPRITPDTVGSVGVLSPSRVLVPLLIGLDRPEVMSDVRIRRQGVRGWAVLGGRG